MATSTSIKPEYIKGGCECGNNRYKISFPDGAKWPPKANHCHCTQCRKTLGGLFSTFIHIPIKNYFHESSETFKQYKSSDIGRRGFCTNCGGGLYFFETNDPDEAYAVTASSVDPEYLTPGLLGGLAADLYAKNAVHGVDDVAGKDLKRFVGNSQSEQIKEPGSWIPSLLRPHKDW